MKVICIRRVKHRPGKPEFFNPEKFRPERHLNSGLSYDLSNVMRTLVKMESVLFSIKQRQGLLVLLLITSNYKKIVATLYSVLIYIEAKNMFVSRNLVTVYLARCCGVEKCAKMK